MDLQQQLHLKMNAKKKKYNLPVGYSLLQTTLRSNEFLNSPVKFVSKSMEAFSGTYSAALGFNRKMILTQNPDFINYVLKENHRNYSKSELATVSAVELFGKGLLFSKGDYWLRQRRLIQPAFHREKLQGLYDIIIRTIDEFLPTFPTGESIDIYPLVHRLSFQILIRSLFDIKLSSKVIEELSHIFTSLQDFLITDINQPLRRIFYPFTGTKSTQLRKSGKVKRNFYRNN
jgi:cytochrome P450